MATAPGQEGWASAAGRNGVGNPAGKANPSLQDKDTNTMNGKPIMKATAHMEGMTKDGGNPADKWNPVKNHS